MKIELWHIIFSVFFIFIVFWFFVKGGYLTKEEDAMVTYTEYLTNACDDAMATVDKEETIVFNTDKKREKAINQFYYTLGRCMDYAYTNREPLLYQKIPCVILIDNDGFYVNYTQKDTGSDGMTYYNQVYSGINTWLEKYDSYFIQYFLDNTIKVTKIGSDKVFEGNYKDVYEQIVNSGLAYNPVVFLEDDNKFKLEKDAAIINTVNKQAEYYINNHNEAFMENHIKYSFTMSKSTEDALQGKLEAPAVLSFIQSPQTSVTDEFINVYALSASQKKKVMKYYICKNANNDLYYHEEGCSQITSDAMVYSSMKDAAKHGANPCPECMGKIH